MPVTVFINGQATNSNQQHGDSRKRSECSGKNLNRNIFDEFYAKYTEKNIINFFLFIIKF
jgi:hypothetical protein